MRRSLSMILIALGVAATWVGVWEAVTPSETAAATTEGAHEQIRYHGTTACGVAR